MNAFLAPAWLVAGNLAAFCLLAGYLLSRTAQLSHHWIFLMLEGLILAQAEFLRDRALLITLLFLSAAVLAVSLIRIETIYLSRHMIHFSLAWTAGAIVHLRLRTASKESSLFRRVNAVLAVLCAVAGGISFFLALRQDIWWGIGTGP